MARSEKGRLLVLFAEVFEKHQSDHLLILISMISTLSDAVAAREHACQSVSAKNHPLFFELYTTRKPRGLALRQKLRREEVLRREEDVDPQAPTRVLINHLKVDGQHWITRFYREKDLVRVLIL